MDHKGHCSFHIILAYITKVILEMGYLAVKKGDLPNLATF